MCHVAKAVPDIESMLDKCYLFIAVAFNGEWFCIPPPLQEYIEQCLEIFLLVVSGGRGCAIGIK